MQQQNQQVSHATIWSCSFDPSLLHFACHFMHQAGEELLAPVHHWALLWQWPQQFMGEYQRLLQMGRNHLQFRWDDYWCLPGFQEPSGEHLSVPWQPHGPAAPEPVQQLTVWRPATGIAVLQQHCCPWCQLQPTQWRHGWSGTSSTPPTSTGT